MNKALILALALLLPFSAPALETQKQGEISYVSGGVGNDERDAIKAMQKDFNLRLMFATQEGPYLSGTHVEILDSKGVSVLATVSDGPFFYAQLPAGTYTVKAGSEPTVQSKQATLAASGHRELNFYW